MDPETNPQQPEEQNATTAAEKPWEDESFPDPLLRLPPSVVREGDFVILDFADGKQIFAQCVKSWKGKSPPVKINKRCYPTANLVGLPYGTVLELGVNELTPLPDGEGLLPNHPSTSLRASPVPYSTGEEDGEDGNTTTVVGDDDEIGGNNVVENMTDSTFPNILDQSNDNRYLVDDRTNQSMDQRDLARLRESGADGSTIVAKLIENSTSFSAKTDFSKAKYIERKQKKYQLRCRMVQCTGATICRALFHKDPRKLMNLREDTLGQILSYSNVSAGSQVLVMETCMGVITGALAQRMGGYGKILSVYTGQQPACLESLERFNLSFAETHSIKWVHAGDVFESTIASHETLDASGVATATNEKGNSVAEGNNNCNAVAAVEEEPEKVERERLEWPCPLQDHTRSYLENMSNEQDRVEFLAKRCARFCRKLTRHTPMEAKEWLQSRLCDSIVIVAKYDPSATLLGMLPYLAPSCPFVVFCEFMEPLSECFREIQRQELAINLRLSDTWMRGYQVLPGRTHPHMTMSQSGGFLLTGIKLCPETGHNELSEEVRAQIRAQIGGRRGRRPKNKTANEDDAAPSTADSRGKKGGTANSPTVRDSKRARVK